MFNPSGHDGASQLNDLCREISLNLYGLDISTDKSKVCDLLEVQPKTYDLGEGISLKDLSSGYIDLYETLTGKRA